MANPTIQSEDYVSLAAEIYKVLGPGTGSYGYGQTTQTPDYDSMGLDDKDLSGSIISVAQWDTLRYDLSSIYLHQQGVVPNLVIIQKGDVIDDTAADPLVNYATFLNNAISDRFSLGPGQYTLTQKTNKTYTSSWSNELYCEIEINFATADQARWFFNTGSKIRLTSSRTGGTIKPQNTAWSTLLSTIGSVEFGAGTNPNVNFYTLTNNYQVFYQQSATTPYSANSYKLEAKCDVANNASGTATQVKILVTWLDGYVDTSPLPPPDSVDGTLSLLVEEVLAYNSSGLFPNNNPFVVAQPSSYFVTNITVGTAPPPPPLPPPPPPPPPVAPPPPAVLPSPLTISPTTSSASVTSTVAVKTTSASFTVTSTHSSTVAVTVQEISIPSGGSTSISPSSFSLAPGTSRAIAITSSSPSNTASSYTYRFGALASGFGGTYPIHTHTQTKVTPTYSINVNPTSQTVVQGGTASVRVFNTAPNATITATPISRPSGPLGAPSVVQASSSGTYIWNFDGFDTSVNPVGTYTWRITATGTQGSVTTSITLTPAPTPPPPTYTITASPTSQTRRVGQTASIVVSGCAPNATISYSGFSSGTVQANSSGFYTWIFDGNATTAVGPGTYTWVLTATGTQGSATATIILNP